MGRSLGVVAIVAVVASTAEADARPAVVVARQEPCRATVHAADDPLRPTFESAQLDWYFTLTGEARVWVVSLDNPRLPFGRIRIRIALNDADIKDEWIPDRLAADLAAARSHHSVGFDTNASLDVRSLPGTICVTVAAIDEHGHKVVSDPVAVALVPGAPISMSLDFPDEPSHSVLVTIMGLHALLVVLIFVRVRRRRVARAVAGPGEALPVAVCYELLRGAFVRALVGSGIATAAVVYVKSHFELPGDAGCVITLWQVLDAPLAGVLVGIAALLALAAGFAIAGLRRVRTAEATATVHDRLVVVTDPRGTSSAFASRHAISAARERVVPRARVT